VVYPLLSLILHAKKKVRDKIPTLAFLVFRFSVADIAWVSPITVEFEYPHQALQKHLLTSHA